MDQYLQMISNVVTPWLIYLNSYLSTYGWVSLIIFLVLILVALKLTEGGSATKKKSAKHKVHIDPEIHAIAGDDLVTTQLDLARAYIEMDNRRLAKEILKEVMKQGDAKQKQEAERLLKCV